MLYVTTRDQRDAHTAYKTLISDTAQDGGCYIPFRTPILEAKDVDNLLSKGFSDIVTTILNRLFSANLTAWSLDFSVGRNCAKVWHNPEKRYSAMEKALFNLIGKEHQLPESASQWAKIAIRFATLFGIYSQMLCSEVVKPEEEFDISVPADDFTAFMAAWYAKENGLPIRMILCGCDTESGVWDLIHRGEVSTSGVSETIVQGLERLVYGKWGREAALDFVTARNESKTFAITEEMPKLSDSCFCSVVGSDRLNAVVNSVYRTDNCLIDKKTALSYAAMQDYRAKSGENRITLIFADADPTLSAQLIADATGLTWDGMAALARK